MPIVLRCLLVTVLVIAGSPVKAVEPPLRMAMMALAPYAYKNEKGKWEGNLYDISKEILREGGFTGYVRAYPVKRMMTLLKRGEADCTITAAVPYMEQNHQKIQSLGIELEFGVLPRSSVSIVNYEDLQKITIAIPRGAKLGVPFDTDTNIKKVKVLDYENAMRLLTANRVDGAAGVISSLMFSANKQGLDTLKYGEPYIFYSLSINVYCQLGTPIESFWPKLEKAITALKQKGVIKKIMEEYGGPKILEHGH